MATIIHGIPALNSSQIRNGLRTLGHAFLAWRAERSRRATILRELGLSRYDCNAIARGTFER